MPAEAGSACPNAAERSSAGQVVVLQPAGGDVGGVLLVDVVALVQLGQLLGGHGRAHLVDHVGQLGAVGLGQFVLDHGHHVVGRQHLLVVLEQHPALVGDSAA